MKDLFPGYYRPTEEEFRQLWTSCTFVLDANVLLNLYRYPEEAREDLFKVLTEVAGRLWIPYHVALEFQRNRLGVMAEQSKRFVDVKKVLDATESTLVNGLDNLQLKKRHASINPDKFITKVREVLQSFRQELESLEKNQPHVYDEDKLQERISALFENKIGPAPNGQEDLDSLFQEGARRYKNKIPPGYCDVRKGKSLDDDEFSYGGLIYKEKFGDFTLWKQILDEVKRKKTKYLLLITDDGKDDWWCEVDSLGKKVIGPRPELVEEIYREVKTSFYMYNSERFMEFSEKYLAVKVKAASIVQVRDFAELRRRAYSLEPPIEDIVNGTINWIHQEFPNFQTLVSPTYDVDIFTKGPSGEDFGVDVIAFSRLTIEEIRQILDARLGRPTNITHMVLVLVIPGQMEGSNSLVRFARDIQRVIYDGLAIVPYDEIYLGALGYDLHQQPLFRPLRKCGRQGTNA